jgi:uncharacterized protein YvpB
MRNNFKGLLFMMLLFTNILFTGCLSNTRTDFSNGQDTKIQDTKTEERSIQNKKNTEKKKPKKVLLDVPIIAQNPELNNGCEITSLAMLLQYAGVNADKMTLSEEIKKDKTPLLHDENGNIKQWGNPNEGFVGDITGKNDGFGVYQEPMIELMEQYMPGRSVDLSKQPFESLIKSIDEGHPVIVWVTAEFKAPKEYNEWEKNGVKIKATFDEHAVVLVVYDKKYCYINNPLSEKKNQKIKKTTFKKVWSVMGNMAISYK